MTNAQVAELCAALPGARALTSLDVGGNYAGAEGARALAACLPTISLRCLSVADNVLLDRFLSDKEHAYVPGADDVRPPDCAGLQALLRACTTARLTRLDVSYNHLGEEGAAALADVFAGSSGTYAALSLVLGFSKLTPRAVGQLAAALRRPAGCAGDLALAALDLRNNTLRAEGAAALADALRVGADDSCALAVARLSVMNNHIGADGARALARALSAPGEQRNPFLLELDVSSNCLGAAGVSALAAVLGDDSRLESLLLHRNNAGDDGAAALATALARTTALRALRLSNNHVHSAGAAALAAGLAANASLTSVDLTRNHFSPDDDAQLRAACAPHPGRELLLGHGPI